MPALSSQPARRPALLAIVLLPLLLALALSALAPPPWSRPWLDLQLRLAAPATPPTGVLVYDIDETALQALRPQFGSWPLPREVYASAIDALREAGARAIVINLLLADPREGDAALAEAIARPGAPVLLASAGQGGFNASHSEWAEWSSWIEPSTSLATDGQPLATGLISAPLDDDGRLRQVWLQHRSLNHPESRPALPLAVLQALGAPSAAAEHRAGRLLPLLHAGPQGGVPTHSFAELLRAAKGADRSHPTLREAAGQVVFIGTSALLSDRAMTAVGQFSGTALQAQVYAALRDGRSLQNAPWPLPALLLLLALLPGLFALWRGRTLPWLFSGLALLLAPLLALGLPAWSAIQGQWVLDPTPALLTLLLGLVAHLWLHQRWTQTEARERRHAQQLAEQANATKTQFLATMSHELRTPLAAVLGLAELLERGKLDDTQAAQVSLLHRAGGNLLQLVDELLDLSRIELGKLQLAEAPTDLHQLLHDAVNLMQPQAQARRLSCELQIEPGLPEWVQADAARLLQVLLNLLGNALKYTAQGSAQLLAGPLPDGRIAFTVSDTGVGLAASQLQRIFEPFMHAEHRQSTRYASAGLGLSISRQLVRLMGGELEAMSVPGAGSRFSFALQLPSSAAPRPSEPTQPVKGGLRVLLAEDDPMSADVLRQQLEALGQQVDVASNGNLALAMAQRKRYDIVLLDLQLSGLTGPELARAIRRHEAEQGLARCPLLSLSAHGYAEDAEASLAAGCDAHYVKPIRLGVLQEALRRWGVAS